MQITLTEFGQHLQVYLEQVLAGQELLLIAQDKIISQTRSPKRNFEQRLQSFALDSWLGTEVAGNQNPCDPPYYTLILSAPC